MYIAEHLLLWIKGQRQNKLCPRKCYCF